MLSCDGRVVKALDLKSNGVSPRRFEPCSQRYFYFLFPSTIIIISSSSISIIDIIINITLFFSVHYIF